MNVLRDILRRKGRSALTVTGIAIGMFALVVLGAVSENMNVYIERATAYLRMGAMVMDAGENGPMGMPSGTYPLTPGRIAAAARQPGVAACLPSVILLLEDGVTNVGLSAAPMVMGFPAEFTRYDTFWSAAKGRFWKDGERGVVVVGQDFAKRRRVGVGDTVEVRGERFEVIGVLARSYITMNDSSVYMSLEDARRLFAATLPDAFKKSLKPEEMTFAAYAFPKPGYTAADISKSIEKGVPGVKTLDQGKMFKTINGYMAVFNTILGSLAALGLVIGGLTIVNTMTMAVSERTREVGVMRALGASRWRIARDVLLESAVVGALGGVGGIALGALASVALGTAVTMSTGVNLFMLTWRLVAFAMGFAVFLGTFAGLYPAWHAARMDPVVALAYQ